MRVRALALLLLLPLAAACTGSSSPQGSPSSQSPAPRVTRTITTTTTTTPLPLPTVEGKPVHFSIKGGNVGCDLEPTFVECAVRSHTFTSPHKPSDCHNFWGTVVQFTVGTKGTFICWFGKSVLGAKRVLPLNQALTVGFVTCRAITGGVECQGQGGGFLITASRYRVF